MPELRVPMRCSACNRTHYWSLTQYGRRRLSASFERASYRLRRRPECGTLGRRLRADDDQERTRALQHGLRGARCRLRKDLVVAPPRSIHLVPWPLNQFNIQPRADEGSPLALGGFDFAKQKPWTMLAYSDRLARRLLLNAHADGQARPRDERCSRTGAWL